MITQNSLSDNKKSLISLLAAMLLMLVNLGVSFFLTPFIIKNIGSEANGFISLANNFVVYATVITVAFTSMGSRFITVNFHRKNIKAASEYYSSIFFTILFINLILLILGAVLIMFLDSVINIPTGLVFDVKMLFLLIFINFCVNLMIEVFVIPAYASNNLYKISLLRSVGAIIKVVTLIILFGLLSPSVYYVGVATIISSCFLLIKVLIHGKKNAPVLIIRKKFFSFKKVKTLVGSGVWNTVTTAGNMLSGGFDLLFANIFISPGAMGILAIPKMLSTIAANLLVTVTGSLMPLFTMKYAKNNIDQLVSNLKVNIRINGVFASVIFAWVFVFSLDFFRIWVPSEDSRTLWLLTVISLQSVFWSGGVDALHSVFSITNKLKVNAILHLILGVVIVVLIFVLLQITDLGIFVVAGVAQVVNSISNLTYTPVFSAKYLGVNKLTFYPSLIRNVLSATVAIVILLIIKNFMPAVASWFMVLVTIFISSVVCFFIGYCIIFTESERIAVNKIVQKLRQKRGFK